MREQNPPHSHDHGLASDLKSAARDAMRLGAHYAEAGRAWLNERTTMMNHRQHGTDWRDRHDQGPGSAPAQGSRGQAAQGPREPDDGVPAGEHYGPGSHRNPGRDTRATWQQHSQSQPHRDDDPWQSHPRAGHAGAGRHRDHGPSDPYRRTTGGHAYGGPQEREDDYRRPRQSGHAAEPDHAGSGYRGTGRDWDSGADYGLGGYGPSGTSRLEDPSLELGRYGGGRQMEYGFGMDEDWSRRSGEYGRGYGEGSGYTEAGPYPPPHQRQHRAGSSAEQRQRGSHRGRGPRQYTRSDERILEDICERLTDDDYIDASDITVRVDSGMATLSGEVPERWMKHRAEDLADACHGVRQVENRVRVESGGWSAGSYATRTAASGERGTTPGLGTRSDPAIGGNDPIAPATTSSSGSQTH